MSFTVPLSYAPMEARLAAAIPRGEGWQYEPKWDGFRCLAFRDGDDVRLQSKSGRPLERYFPEVVAHLRALGTTRFVIDGELVIAAGDALSFDDLLQRIHPAASRIVKLSHDRPATYLLFDLLGEGDESLVDRTLRERRARLEAFVARGLATATRGIALSPATSTLARVDDWYARVGGALDGVIAKRLDAPYRSGERDAVVKSKRSALPIASLRATASAPMVRASVRSCWACTTTPAISRTSDIRRAIRQLRNARCSNACCRCTPHDPSHATFPAVRAGGSETPIRRGNP